MYVTSLADAGVHTRHTGDSGSCDSGYDISDPAGIGRYPHARVVARQPVVERLTSARVAHSSSIIRRGDWVLKDTLSRSIRAI